MIMTITKEVSKHRWMEVQPEQSSEGDIEHGCEKCVCVCAR